MSAAEGESAGSTVCFTYQADCRSKNLVAINDLFIISTKERVLGIARVERVTSEEHDRSV